MLSYSEYKLKEANEPPQQAPGGASPSPAAASMPDPTTGAPPGGDPSASSIGSGIMGGMPSGGGPDLGMGMPGGSPPADAGQKPTALNLKSSNFWDVLEKILKDH